MSDLQNNPPLDLNFNSKLLNNNDKSNNEVIDFKLLILKALSSLSDNEIPLKKELTSIKQGIVYTVDLACDLIRKEGYLLGHRDKRIYFYNGAFWSPVVEEELQVFLTYLAKAMGMEDHNARLAENLEKMIKQILVTATSLRKKEPSSIPAICLKNGVYRFGSEPKFTGFEPSDFFYYQLPYEYDAQATAPLFQAYLDEVIPEKEKQQLLQEFVGSVFIRHKQLKLEKALMLLGPSQNGKSVFFDIVLAALGGAENVTSYSLRALTDSSGQTRAQFDGKLLNYTSEVGNNIDSEYFKQLVSGEPIEARFLYNNSFLLTDYGKLMFNANDLPPNLEKTSAMYRRWLIIPFDVTIPKEKQDKQLSQKIIASDLPGVLNWMIEGMQRVWQQKGYTEFEFQNDIIQEYRLDDDPIAGFIQEKGLKKSFEKTEMLKVLYPKFRNYCEDQGLKYITNKTFKQRLVSQFGFKSKRVNGGVAIYCELQGPELDF